MLLKSVLLTTQEVLSREGSLRHRGFPLISAGDRGVKTANPSDKGTEEMKFQFFLVFNTEMANKKTSR